ASGTLATSRDERASRHLLTLEPAYCAVGDVVRPGDVDQGLTRVTSPKSLLALMGRQLRLAAHHYPSRYCTLPALAGTAADQFTFEFGEAAKHCQHKPAVRRSGVSPAIPEGPEAGAFVGNRPKHVQQIAGGSRQPVEPGHDQDVTFA